MPIQGTEGPAAASRRDFLIGAGAVAAAGISATAFGKAAEAHAADDPPRAESPVAAGEHDHDGGRDRDLL